MSTAQSSLDDQTRVVPGLADAIVRKLGSEPRPEDYGASAGRASKGFLPQPPGRGSTLDRFTGFEPATTLCPPRAERVGAKTPERGGWDEPHPHCLEVAGPVLIRPLPVRGMRHTAYPGLAYNQPVPVEYPPAESWPRQHVTESSPARRSAGPVLTRR
jgi:hypothetical protein